ncbi:MAG: pyruvate:ferredoxin (flavodoxin) oxidoreductase [Spirochaetes bacterium GWF1_41_5]|nr:MAG: pyruvate:ferredoxin (flavodoxin) oxidoreductase [Spirochaetes bacterium GWF1_41_5]
MSKKLVSIDGNTAAAHVAYAFSDVAAIYPITPSSNMGEYVDEWASKGRKNMFGEILKVVELQSEGGASGAVHGSLSAGALTTTFTASQGLMLMLPNMHKIAGELLPAVFHVSARSLACQSLSIFGDHSDVMSARNTGWAMMAAASIQETQDLAIVAHLATLKSCIPFLNFFDGFRTSHEILNIDLMDYETMKGFLEPQYIEQFRKRALNSEHPAVKVAQQSPDVYFQGREVSNQYYLKIPEIVKEYLKKVAKITGRTYNLFDYIGSPDADKVIIAMGSACETIEETINYLVKKGQKVGAVKVRLYRPFSVEDFINVIPKSVKKIAVLDRTKEPGSIGEPLYLDTLAALQGRNISIVGGRYGLSSKEFTPTMVKAVYDHLDGKNSHNFTVGIEDDVTHLSLKLGEKIDAEQEGIVCCKFWGYGSDGTVGANKNSIKIIGDHTDMYIQAYFVYDSKKSGGVTVSHLRFGKKPIQSEYLVEKAGFIALHKFSYIGRYDILENIVEGGTFLINSVYGKEEVFNYLTEDMQKTIISKKIKVYTINADKIAEELGLAALTSSIMQVAFFKLANVIPVDDAMGYIKKAIEKTFGKKGEKIVKMNLDAVDRALANLHEVIVPAKAEKCAPLPRLTPDNSDDFTRKIIDTVMHLKGDTIPVSAMPHDGVIPTGTTRLEKRGVALNVPAWKHENCIQCNFCSLVCPHAAIRVKQIAPADLVKAPEGFTVLDSNTKNDRKLKFRVQVYCEDCVGCGSCVNVCPGKKGEKALIMTPLADVRNTGETRRAVFFDELPNNVTDGTDAKTVKGSQFLMPYFEFSGACAGCGETPYVKLITQLFGDRMIVANATGCSSIYGGTFPTIPYCKDKRGWGPAWGNSLFEDNAEYGYGMRLAVNQNRVQLKTCLQKFSGQSGIYSELTSCINYALVNFDAIDEPAKNNAVKLKQLMPEQIQKLSGESRDLALKIYELADFLIQKSVWCFGGDGWAYDIGYGGLDHVIASGENINILVLDTEVYSNTGGQASKATPIAARAKFAEAGKEIRKKDLGLMAMSYGYVYVATCSMGANKNQLVKALMEAESYNGPSLVICYAPCIAHGINMSSPQENMARAVESGHWPLYRYNPLLAKDSKNPLTFDSKEISLAYEEYIMKETRFKSLKSLFPEKADALYKKAEDEDKAHFEYIRKLSQIQ